MGAWKLNQFPFYTTHGYTIHYTTCAPYKTGLFSLELSIRIRFLSFYQLWHQIFWSMHLNWPLLSLTLALHFFFFFLSTHCFWTTWGIIRKLKFCFPSYFGITQRNTKNPSCINLYYARPVLSSGFMTTTVIKYKLKVNLNNNELTHLNLNRSMPFY